MRFLVLTIVALAVISVAVEAKKKNGKSCTKNKHCQTKFCEKSNPLNKKSKGKCANKKKKGSVCFKAFGYCEKKAFCKKSNPADTTKHAKGTCTSSKKRDAPGGPPPTPVEAAEIAEEQQEQQVEQQEDAAPDTPEDIAVGNDMNA